MPRKLRIVVISWECRFVEVSGIDFKTQFPAFRTGNLHAYHKQILILKFKKYFTEASKHMRFRLIVWLFTFGDFEPQVPSVNSVSQALNDPPDSSGPSLGGASLEEEEHITEQDKWPPRLVLKKSCQMSRPRRLKYDTLTASTGLLSWPEIQHRACLHFQPHTAWSWPESL